MIDQLQNPAVKEIISQHLELREAQQLNYAMLLAYAEFEDERVTKKCHIAKQIALAKIDNDQERVELLTQRAIALDYFHCNVEMAIVLASMDRV